MSFERRLARLESRLSPKRDSAIEHDAAACAEAILAMTERFDDADAQLTASHLSRLSPAQEFAWQLRFIDRPDSIASILVRRGLHLPAGDACHA